MATHDRKKNRYVGVTDIQWPMCILQGVPMPVIADLPEGAFVQWVAGDNPIGIPTPGPHVRAGSMILMLPPELAVHMRKVLLDEWDKAETVDMSDLTG